MRISNRIAVTGANGFLGRSIVARLAKDGHQVTTCTRTPHKAPGSMANVVIDLLNGAPAPEILRTQDLVIHLAGNASGGAPSVDPASSENAHMARVLAKALATAQVPNLIVLSSAMAKLAEDNPGDARHYGLEKAAADRAVLEELGPDQRAIFLRPPAIYGPGMRGSLATLAKLVAKGVPLPLGAASTPRPYLSLSNLTDLVSAAAQLDPVGWHACDRKFLEMHDGELISTAELVRAIGRVLRKPTRVLPMPASILYGLAKVVGKSDLIDSAFATLPMSPTHELNKSLGWSPAETMPESLAFLRDN
jgi:nucleoside-diphosphate-sugar epimerase